MRQSWTVDRLDDLSHRMDERFDPVEAEMDQRFGRVETEVKAGFERVDDDISALHTDFLALQRTMIQVGGGVIAALVGLTITSGSSASTLCPTPERGRGIH